MRNSRSLSLGLPRATRRRARADLEWDAMGPDVVLAAWPIAACQERALALLTEHADAGVLSKHARFDVLLARRP
ncbi:hypothetical protein OHU34_44865 (plasmid) [Streptomyces sp. NBC_00080]|uniref:hypothetical protein n=1 Tax=unclassified Streptomyces TaxID=2593676 RepID=UPI001152E728|nr:hypothetical protein [Streptomyces sp. SLBN-115]